jgi:hypothetical protein
VLGIDNRISGSGRKISARFLNNWGSRSGNPIQVIGDERKPTVKRDGIVKAFSTGVVLSWCYLHIFTIINDLDRRFITN